MATGFQAVTTPRMVNPTVEWTTSPVTDEPLGSDLDIIVQLRHKCWLNLWRRGLIEWMNL